MKKLRRIVNALLWLLVGSYVTLVVLLNIPAVQRFVCNQVETVLSETLGTRVEIESVDISFLNRIIIDNIFIEDQSEGEMLRASRVSAKLNLLDLINGRISISSAQLFGLKANLYRATPDSQPNFQFVIDSLASNDEKESSPINLQISSLLVRRGQISYNVLSDQDADRLSPQHINLSNISSHIILNSLTNDTLNLHIKKIAMKDRSGFELKRLSCKLALGRTGGTLQDFNLELPQTKVQIPLLAADFKMKNSVIEKSSVALRGSINIPHLTLSDASCFAPELKQYSEPFSLIASFQGENENLDFGNIEIRQANNLYFNATASLQRYLESALEWSCQVKELRAAQHSIAASGTLGGTLNSAKVNAEIASDLGHGTIKAEKSGNKLTAKVIAEALNLAEITQNAELGNMSAEISATATLNKDLMPETGKAVASVSDFTFRNHKYNDIDLQAELLPDKALNATADVHDPFGSIALKASINSIEHPTAITFDGEAKDLNPNSLALTEKWPDTSFDFALSGEINGTDINTAQGHLNVSDFTMQSASDRYSFRQLAISKYNIGKHQQLVVKGDFIALRLEGDFDYSTLSSSLASAVHHRLPTMPGLENTRNERNQLQLYATLNNAEFLRQMLDIPITMHEPAHVIADIDDTERKFYLSLDASDFTYNATRYTNGYVLINTPADTLRARAAVSIPGDSGNSHFELLANANNNHLVSTLQFATNGENAIHGSLNTDSRFATNAKGLSEARINVLSSDVFVADSVWTITPSLITYYKNNLQIGQFSVRHDNQHITIGGRATESVFDEIELNLKDVNVSYILELVGFDSVDFDGSATVRAKARALFSRPEADAHVNVRNFAFESGYMGTLIADANWNIDEGAINIDGIIMDDGEHHSTVKGYVSPKNSDIDLRVHADGIRVGFVQKYTQSFLSNLTARAWGNVNVIGPFKAIQLIGEARVEGSVDVPPLGTSYTLTGGSVVLTPDNIALVADTISDRNGNIAIIDGNLPHRHLGHFTYDIDIAAHNLLALDLPAQLEDDFWGTVYATGECNIREAGDDTVIEVNARPERGSEIVYNATSPDAIANHEYITWKTLSSDSGSQSGNATAQQEYSGGIGGLRINLLIHSNPNATLKVLMDKVSGDYIALHGNGVLRASYYSKGSFDLFGNYVVSDGIYTLTVQNILKREFEFLSGGTISFGGDAYNAGLNLQAQYTLNSVPLADINIGRSFTNNNVRVDCLMNITGTPGAPKVDFSIDLPTVSTDAKQMIMSLMQSEEEVNQQALYLLAVGRFLNQQNNSSYSDASRQSQTSLAMQSILSGTISQQISSILGNVVRSGNWNFGANISTGDEGFNNAEYEGLVSGRLLNNRLLIDGQFGYRDNMNATSSFIGDFDIRYLLVPNGNTAIKVYNQTNDKYFTKNSLNTQGIGLIIKRDFNRITDILPRRSRIKANQKK